MIAAGASWRPSVVAGRAGSQVVTVEFIKATARELQFHSGPLSAEESGAELSQNMANKRKSAATSQLGFSCREFNKNGRCCQGGGFFAFYLLQQKGEQASRAVQNRPGPSAVCRLQTALRLRPRRALSSAEAKQGYQLPREQQESRNRSPVLPTTACPVLLTTPSGFANYKTVRFCSHRDTVFHKCRH